jgi:hypothetical protein
MPSAFKKFNPNEVIRSFKGNEIKESKLFDFVEVWIEDPALKTWEKHLRDQGVPYVVTAYNGNWYPILPTGKKGAKRQGKIAIIWKHLVVPYAENNRQK